MIPHCAADCPCFDELSKFTEAGDFLSLGWQRNGGAYVQAKNYVGVIRLPSGFQIEILPKIYACVVRENNLNFFKGKLLVRENLRRNVAHREKFFVAFDEYNIDCPEHRLIKSTLLKLLRGTHDKKNFRLATRLLADFDSVAPSVDYRKDFEAVSRDRNNRDYNVVMAWTKIFLADKSFTALAGKSDALALLFPMEKLFEAYVARYVRKIFSDRFTVKTQVAEKFLFDTPRRFALKPDIILDGDETIILDTKWKSQPSAGDMYQMVAYAKRYSAKKIFLLCPRNIDENISYRSDDGLDVTVFYVDLFDIDASLKKIFDD